MQTPEEHQRECKTTTTATTANAEPPGSLFDSSEASIVAGGVQMRDD